MTIIYKKLNINFRKSKFCDICIKTQCKILNNKIKCINDMKNIKGSIIIANHYNGIDAVIISRLSSNNKYVIVKDDILSTPETKNYLTNLCNSFSNIFFEGYGLIPYTRGCKKSGIQVKKKILEITRKGYNVIVFAEGTSTRYGKSKEFKNGIFRLSVDNNIPIIPITLIYDKNIGLGKGDFFKIEDFMNNKVLAIIHPTQISKDWKFLKKKVSLN